MRLYLYQYFQIYIHFNNAVILVAGLQISVEADNLRTSIYYILSID